MKTLTGAHRARHGCGVLLAVLCVLSFGCASPEPLEPDTLTRIGLQLPDSPLVSIRIAFRTGSVADPDGKRLLRRTLEGDFSDADAVGVELGERLLADGGRAILDDLIAESGA